MKILALIKLLETRKKQFGNIEVVDDLGEDETGEDDVGHNFTEGLFEAVLNDSRRYKKEYFNFLVTIPRTTM